MPSNARSRPSIREILTEFVTRDTRTTTKGASEADGRDGPGVDSQGRSYGSGARLLSVGIATTGVLTFAYFSIASHVLGEVAAKRVDLLWSIMFVIISVIYRPIEQLLSRTIADRRARGHAQHSVRVPLAIQASFALAFLAVALALEEELVNNVFDHYSALYYVLVVGTLAYAASYFARGWLAGHEYFELFGGLVLMEAFSRLCFVVAVAFGVASGQTAVALGIAAAPFVSLVVVPAAFARMGTHPPPRAAPALEELEELDAALAGPGTEGIEEAVAADELSLRRGSGFAFAVSGVMLSEQTLLNAAVLTVDITSVNAALAGIVFNVLLIARAPLQLFQAIQTSLLPHLTGLEATEGHEAFARVVRVTVLAIAAFAGAVALGLLAIGPPAMKALFGQSFEYGRVGLALIGLGMGMHLTSGALNQAALARDQARAAAVCWLVAAVAFVAWMLLPLVSEELLRTEIGYLGATSLLALMLATVYRRGAPARQTAPAASASAR
jgi:O-antigen/teichoic acid export membrane protein